VGNTSSLTVEKELLKIEKEIKNMVNEVGSEFAGYMDLLTRGLMLIRAGSVLGWTYTLLAVREIMKYVVSRCRCEDGEVSNNNN